MALVQQFLVKMPPAPPNVTLAISGTDVAYEITPLLPSIQPHTGMRIAGEAIWHVLKPTMAVDHGNPWDFCHALVTNGLGIAGGQKPIFAEPDLQQQWIWGTTSDQVMAMTSSCQSADQKTGPQGFPGDPDKLWYQNEAHGQFKKVLLAPSSDDKTVRIAHLDTGYDPEHQSLPKGLERNLQRNFVDADRPNNASDMATGLFNNRGHGTGTLSILAGNSTKNAVPPGAAPFAKVVPIRVANHVEIFYNSAIARAFNYVHALCKNPETEVQVVTMSMGGLASQAWADAINALYEAGVVVVTAAGNNFGKFPTRNIVYPARFNRVIAACGVMADHSPYTDLPLNKMAGNYGPLSKMRTAIAAYTPNVPWAKFGCSEIMDFDGRGTSAATPQVAAAAAIWLQKNRAAWEKYPQKWMRVEAVRKALFDSAHLNGQSEKLGRGELRAFDATAIAPAAVADLKAEEPDTASFGIFRVLTGLGIQELNPQQQMFELEALQLSQSAEIEALLPDSFSGPESLTPVQRTQLAEALARHPRASSALRNALRSFVAIQNPPATKPLTTVEQAHLKHALAPQPPQPRDRRIRVYAYDPSLGRELETVGFNKTTISLPWEADLEPGPVGEYVEIVDIDPASKCCYAPVDLNDPRLIATDGLGPSETNPQFHQQMVYAVAMATIKHFERALGRVALWSPRFARSRLPSRSGNETANPMKEEISEVFVRQLRIYPHALRAQNAYYSPERKALLLGYFSSDEIGNNRPREMVFTALSHDIVAHETSHALLDGLHRRFREATNPDVLAFHEAFADIVALFQHFSLRDSLRDQIARSRADLAQENLLPKLAVQFGKATGRYGALRDSIGRIEEDEKTGKKVWKPVEPSSDQYNAAKETHELGAVLVAAVFDAFLKVYNRRILQAVRLATNGSEILPPGALAAGLADVLTDEASKTAETVLLMCIRALDYCPPVDITFGDYLRAIITADRDLVPDDRLGYRVAFVSAFAERGIYPRDVRSLSVETMLWEPPPVQFETLTEVLPSLSLEWNLQSRRDEAWDISRSNAKKFWQWLINPKMVSDHELAVLGLNRHAGRRIILAGANGEQLECDVHGIEVHSVRPSRRVGPDAQLLSQLVVEITQSYYPVSAAGEVFRGGVTLLIDLTKQIVTYMVRKRADHSLRITEQLAFRAAKAAEAADNYFELTAKEKIEPFRLLHNNEWRKNGLLHH